MSVTDCKIDSSFVASLPPLGCRPRKLHRIAEVRQHQGVSLRSAARRMRIDMATVKNLENAETDMPLTTLYKWQEVLEVPVGSLLVDQDDSLSDPVLRRAQLVRLMKTAAAIQESAANDSTKRLALMMIEQLCEIMPELKDVTPWHAVGQRRSLEECGRIAERAIPDQWFLNHNP